MRLHLFSIPFPPAPEENSRLFCCNERILRHMKTDFGFFIAADPELCTGCKACELACFSAHNSSAPGKTVGSLASFVTPNLHVVRTAGGWSLATCRHCEDAPCLTVCQPKAITRPVHRLLRLHSRLSFRGHFHCAPARFRFSGSWQHGCTEMRPVPGLCGWAGLCPRLSQQCAASR